MNRSTARIPPSMTIPQEHPRANGLSQETVWDPALTNGVHDRITEMKKSEQNQKNRQPRSQRKGILKTLPHQEDFEDMLRHDKELRRENERIDKMLERQFGSTNHLFTTSHQLI